MLKFEDLCENLTHRCLTLLLFLAAAGETSLYAKSTVNVLPTSSSYRSVDKLVAAGWVNGIIVGQKPWTRQEFARIAIEGAKNIQNRAQVTEVAPWILNALSDLQAEFSVEIAESTDASRSAIETQPLGEFGFRFAWMDSPYRPLPLDNGLGGTDSLINPLSSYREGHFLNHGLNIQAESTHWVNFGDVLSAYAEPYFQLPAANPFRVQDNLTMNRLYATYQFQNLNIEIGRDSIVWGPEEYGGLIASTNPRPFNLIKLSNDAPFDLWFLGPARLVVFAGELGPDQLYFPHSMLFGYGISVKPFSVLELALFHDITMFGEGAPSTQWYDPVLEALFLRRNQLSVADKNVIVAKHRGGFQIDLQIPQLRNSHIYFENCWGDFGVDSFAADFSYRFSFTLGIYIPLLEEDGSSDLRLAYTYLGPLLYRNSVFVSAGSIDQSVVGFAAGSDVYDLSAVFRKDFSSGLHFEFRPSYDLLYGNTYDQYEEDRVKVVEYFSIERRLRLIARLSRHLAPHLDIGVNLGTEWVKNFDFVEAQDRTNLLTELTLKWTH